jgi:hypothetical protein
MCTGEREDSYLPKHCAAADNAPRSLNEGEGAKYFNESERAAVDQLCFAAAAASAAVAGMQHSRTVFGKAT